MEEKQTQVELNLQDIISAFLKKWWVILLSTVLGAIVFFGASYFTYVPRYQATAKMYVNNKSISIGSAMVGISSSDILASQSLVNTYSEILMTRYTLEEVIERADLDYSYEQLFRMISCGSVHETEIFYISVTCGDPEEAKLIANTIVEVLPDQIATIIDGSSVRTVDAAVRGVELSPGFNRNAGIGALVGLLLSAGLIFLFDVVINDTLESEEWVLSAYSDKIPLLAVIPDVDDDDGYYYRYYRYDHYYTSKEDNKDEKGGSDNA